MDVKKILGVAALVVGIVVLVLALAANAIFGRSPGFGICQILGTIGGILAIGAGLFLILKR